AAETQPADKLFPGVATDPTPQTRLEQTRLKVQSRPLSSALKAAPPAAKTAACAAVWQTCRLMPATVTSTTNASASTIKGSKSVISISAWPFRFRMLVYCWFSVASHAEGDSVGVVDVPSVDFIGQHQKAAKVEM